MIAIAEVWPLRRKAHISRTQWWKNLLSLRGVVDDEPARAALEAMAAILHQDRSASRRSAARPSITIERGT
jgi:hypothetical protein